MILQLIVKSVGQVDMLVLDGHIVSTAKLGSIQHQDLDLALIANQDT